MGIQVQVKGSWTAFTSMAEAKAFMVKNNHKALEGVQPKTGTTKPVTGEWKVQDITCTRCGGSGIKRWVNSFGAQSGVCYLCNGRGTNQRRVLVDVTQADTTIEVEEVKLDLWNFTDNDVEIFTRYHGIKKISKIAAQKKVWNVCPF